MDDYGCDICGIRKPWNEIVWLTARIGLCPECREKMPQVDADKIMDHESESDVIESALAPYTSALSELEV